MTLKEKNDLQQVIIDKLFNYFKKNSSLNNSSIDYFCKKLQEIFKIEMDYYNIRCFNKRNNDVIFEFINEPRLKSHGRFLLKGSLISDDVFKYDTPIIQINCYSPSFNGLISKNVSTRIKSCRDILKTLFHEIRHFRQYLMMSSLNSNKNSLRNAKEFAFTSLGEDDLHEIYINNHSHFAIESDADYNSNKKRSVLNGLDTYEFFDINIEKSNRDVSYLVIPEDNKLYDRDTYIDNRIDDFICNKKIKILLLKYPILLKEYNNDFSKKTISELILNMVNEVNELSQIDNEKNRNTLLNDTTQMYYDLILKRLNGESRVELFEALYSYNNNSISYILNKIKDYNTYEKRRKLHLVREKYNSEVVLNKRKIVYNDGFIVKDDGNLISTKEYISSLKIKTSNRLLKLFLNSESFRKRIPVFGYFILKDSTKISVSDYIKKYIIPYFSSYTKSNNIFDDFDNLLIKTTKPFYELEYLYSCECINKKYQVNSNNLDSIIDVLKTLNNHKKEYNKEEVELMRFISNINESNVDYLINQLLSKKNYSLEFGYYYEFSDWNISFLENILTLSLKLTNDNILNPKKINYYKKLVEEYKIGNVLYEIHKYQLINQYLNKRSK